MVFRPALLPSRRCREGRRHLEDASHALLFRPAALIASMNAAGLFP